MIYLQERLSNTCWLILILAIFSTWILSNSQESFADSYQILSHSLIPSTYMKNMTVGSKDIQQVVPMFLLSGTKGGYSYISNFEVNTNLIPRSDPYTVITIESVQLRMFADFAENSSNKYFVTTHICTDGFSTLDKDALHGDPNLGPFTTYGFYSTPSCSIMSPQDSVVVDEKELPKMYVWDVTNLAAFLIEKENAMDLTFVIAAEPIGKKLPEYYKSSNTNASGLVGFIEPDVSQNVGGNVEPILVITYRTDPSYIVSSFNLIWPIASAIAVPILGYVLKQRRDQVLILNRSSNSILTEINVCEDALTGKKDYQVIKYLPPGENEEVYYTNAFLDFEAYDSVIHSGEFTRLKLDTQDIVRELYTRIKNHNDTIKDTINIEDQYRLMHGKTNEKEVREITVRHEQHLTRLDKEILEYTPKAKQLLTQEIKKF